VTGNLFFVSDENSFLHQITTGGQLVDQWDLLELSGFEDPEGVAIDAETRTIWISFDSDHAVGRFTLPEPAGAGAALAALATLAVRARRRGPAASWPADYSAPPPSAGVRAARARRAARSAERRSLPASSRSGSSTNSKLRGIL